MRRLTLLLAAVALCSCGERKRLPTEGSQGPPDPEATFSRVLGEVFLPSCALRGCHAGESPAAGMSLEAGAAYASTVNARSTQRPELLRVAPFDPDRSYLVKKLRGDPDIAGSPMPLGGSLGAAERQLVIDWVRRGAPRD